MNMGTVLELRRGDRFGSYSRGLVQKKCMDLNTNRIKFCVIIVHSGAPSGAEYSFYHRGFHLEYPKIGVLETETAVVEAIFGSRRDAGMHNYDAKLDSICVQNHTLFLDQTAVVGARTASTTESQNGPAIEPILVSGRIFSRCLGYGDIPSK